MPDSPTGDEFDNLSDVFEDVDWSTIPALNGEPQAQTALPTQDVSVAGEVVPTIPPVRAASAGADSSSNYSFDDDIDTNFLAEVDALERQAASTSTTTASLPDVPSSSNPKASTSRPTDPPAAARKPSSSRPVALSRFFSAPTPLSPTSVTTAQPTRKHPRPTPDPTPLPPTPQHKRLRTVSTPAKINQTDAKEKGKATEDVRQVLQGFEDEITCPICCDLFVAAHLGNPCGHCFCGDCGWAWISKNKRSPTCSICRAPLSKAAPMIPNFVMDNMVDKHIQALGTSGMADWKEGGSKLLEWQARKEQWKSNSAKRAAEQKVPAKRRPPSRIPMINLVNADDDGWLVPDDFWVAPDDDDDESYEEEEAPAAPVSRAASASRGGENGRGGGGGNGTGTRRPRRYRRRRS